MIKKIDSLRLNNIYKLILEEDLPSGTQILPSRWVFSMKSTPDLCRYKARLIARGDRQNDLLVNLYDIYAPVIKQAIIWIFLLIALELKLPLRQYNFQTAFLNDDLDIPVFLQPPLFPGRAVKEL
jgi:hypothetical protein